ncbi:hypothetical protein COLO4_06413 [Corchorus olitorius]|uniref:DYW domain-containing protein n=1 Tax=Corchorus olitorius TaxID=93759 RepID=A0A1R3KN63_9ROSI|nr:hypothetical protein COLO4_06413 [Corchorus olitorius]
MADIFLLSSVPLRIAATQNKIPSIKPASFAQIPSWVSLKSGSSSMKIPQNQQGQVENVHLVSLSKQGKLKEARDFLKQMEDAGVPVNPHSYTSLIQSCSKMRSLSDAVSNMYVKCGWLEGAKLVFDQMVEKNAVAWTGLIMGYTQADQRKDALKLFVTMVKEGFELDENLELGKTAAENLLQLDPTDTAGYVLIFNLYALFGKWEEAAHVRSMMGARKLKKELSCSWITVKGKVHRFVVADKYHPQTEEIYEKLKEFNHSVMKDESELLTEEDVSFDLPERKQQLMDHSERLAIALGLISLPANAPMIVFKNLRACKDCHDFAKHVSMVTGRKITIRDSCRFHHFHSGQCSCNDYW